MTVSSYLEQDLFYDQTSATDQLFEEKADKIFEADEAFSRIEIHVHSPLENRKYEDATGIILISGVVTQKRDSWSESEPLALPPSPVDHCHYLRPDPPSYDGSPGLIYRNIQDNEELIELSLVRSVTENAASKADLGLDLEKSKRLFRVCFIRQTNSYSRLQVTRSLFETLMSEFQIFSRFREFVLLFGAKYGESELGPPRLRSRRLIASDTGSTYQHYAGFGIPPNECAYGLRFVELNYRNARKPWSVRQTAIYHRYEVDATCSTWVMISASKRAELCLDRYIKSSGNIPEPNPFEVHLVLLDTALANWRPYIVDLTERITRQSDRVVVASTEEKDPLNFLDVEERQELKDFEDQIIDILLVLDSTSDTIYSLSKMYKQFHHDLDETREGADGYIFDSIAFALQEKQCEVHYSRKKVYALHTKLQGTIKLLSSLLELGNGYALKQLAREARKENSIMRKLAEKSTQDAAAVKVLTTITLIYLPATVVSNFFSTQFVSQEQQNGGGHKVVVSSNAWLFAAISVPLTLARGTEKTYPPTFQSPTNHVKPASVMEHGQSNADQNESLGPHIVLNSPQTSTITQPLSETQEHSLTSRDKSVSLEDRKPVSLSPADRPSIIQPIHYSLHIEVEGSEVPGLDASRPLRINNDDGYQEIEDVAEKLVRGHFEDALASKELYLRYGSGTIVGDPSYGSGTIVGDPSYLGVQTLMDREEWQNLCKDLDQLWTSKLPRSYKNLRLDIFRKYHAVHNHAFGKKTFATTKRDEIGSLMQQTFNEKDYITRTDLKRVISMNTIRKIILETPPEGMKSQRQEDFVLHVQRMAPRLLAMCVYAKMNMTCLERLLEKGLSDASLPLDLNNCCHPDHREDFRTLLSQQDRFMAAVFWVKGQHQEFTESAILPFRYEPKETRPDRLVPEEINIESNNDNSVDDGDKSAKKKSHCGSGAFSNVYCVKIDPDHHNLSKDRDSVFALKEFKDQPRSRGVEFSRELGMLTTLREHQNEHIVTHLATWTHGDKYCMLFPYARCNLRQYTKRVPFKKLGQEADMWLFKQFCGLADAIRSIHILPAADDPTSAASLVAPTHEIRRSGWHHDLKAENILFFRSNGYKYGTLRIADFGSAKVHVLRSGSANTRSPNGTPTYEAPEASDEGATSRPYDIWSLGCVFLELLTWAVCDSRAVEQFQLERRQRRHLYSPLNYQIDDGFWQSDATGKFTVRKSVLAWIEGLRKKKHAFQDVLDLVVEGMLVTDRKKRITAKDLSNALDKIYEKKGFKSKAHWASLSDRDPTLTCQPLDIPDYHTPEPKTPRIAPPITIHAPVSTDHLMASPVDNISPRSSLNPNWRNSSASETKLSPVPRSRGASISSWGSYPKTPELPDEG